MQPIDCISALLRAVGFWGVFQAGGIALYAGIHRRLVSSSFVSLRRIGAGAAICGLICVFLHQSFEAARMAGDIHGVLDAGLQGFAWSTQNGIAAIVRIAGVLVLLFTIRSEAVVGRAMSTAAAVLALASFALTGHTSSNALRWLLAPLLIAHVLIVAYWFGGVTGLHLASRRDSPTQVNAAANAFSRVAEWLVPVILLAGTVMALLLLPGLSSLAQPYGVLLLTKLGGYGLLIALAVRNKYRLVPAMDRGDDAQAAISFRRAVLAEYVLISAVLIVTAVMTGFFSPEA